MTPSQIAGRGSRSKVLRLLADPNVTVVVVEHRDRLGRMNTELVKAALSAHGRRLVVLDDGEVDDDLVRDCWWSARIPNVRYCSKVSVISSSLNDWCSAKEARWLVCSTAKLFWLMAALRVWALPSRGRRFGKGPLWLSLGAGLRLESGS